MPHSNGMDAPFDMMAQLLADTREKAEVTAPSSEMLGRLQKLAQEQLDLERDIEMYETRIKQKSQRINEIRFKLLPEMLKQVQTRSFEMMDGSIVRLDNKISAKIPSLKQVVEEKDPMLAASLEERRQKALAWLRDNGHGDLIKNEITISLGRGEDDKAAELDELLLEKHINPEREESVHTQTLSAFVREQIQNGRTVPLELFGVDSLDIVKITPKREKKQ